MDTASTYFTRRAREERAKAADAASPEARKAHLQLALRLVRVATEPALWAWAEASSGEGAVAHQQSGGELTDMGSTLAGAFPLPPFASFEHLLEAMDTAEWQAVGG